MWDINSIKTQIQTVAQADFDNTWAVLQTLTGINTSDVQVYVKFMNKPSDLDIKIFLEQRQPLNPITGEDYYNATASWLCRSFCSMRIRYGFLIKRRQINGILCR